MARTLTLLACFVAAYPVVSADDPILADLNRAKAAHAKELARLRDKLLADIDAVIRAENDRGAGINYLLKERKGFADNGVVPVLPKLLSASKAYQVALAKADGQLADVLDMAGKSEDAKLLRGEKPKEVEFPKVEKKVDTKTDLRNFLAGSVWAWLPNNPKEELHLRPNGLVGHANWTALGYVLRWDTIDRRTALLRLEKGRDNNRIAVLMFAEDLSGFKVVEFDGQPHPDTRPRKRE